MFRRLSVVATLVAATTMPAAVSAQATNATAPARFGIVDNSFLVEEAFNQEPGIFQNIVSFTRTREGEWTTMFTQEWPFPRVTHQVSYSLPLGRTTGGTGVGDVLINYRLQAMSETAKRPAFAPRLSVVLPTSDPDKGLGTGAMGWQINLPFSKQVSDVYLHWNGGFTYTPRVRPSDFEPHVGLFSPLVAGSAIWQRSPLLNILFEVVGSSNQFISDDGQRTREHQLMLSPGVRGGWNLGEKQIVVGAAMPITVTTGSTVALLVYFSYETRFRR